MKLLQDKVAVHIFVLLRLFLHRDIKKMTNLTLEDIVNSKKVQSSYTKFTIQNSILLPCFEKSNMEPSFMDLLGILETQIIEIISCRGILRGTTRFTRVAKSSK